MSYDSPAQSLQAWRQQLDGTSGPTAGVGRSLDGYDSPAFSLQRIREIMEGRNGRTPTVLPTVDGYDSPAFSAQRIREILTGQPGRTPGIPPSHDGWDDYAYSLQAIREIYTGQGGPTPGVARTVHGFDAADFSLQAILNELSIDAVPVNMSPFGGEITDLMRTANVQGDGRANEASFGFWNHVTNLITNGGFETNLTGWTTGGTNVLERTSERAKFGSYSAKATYTDNAVLASWAATLTAVIHSFGAWVYIPTNYDGAQVLLAFRNFGSAAGTLTANANMSARDQWQWVRLPRVTPNAGDLAGQVTVENSGAAPTAGRHIYVDGAQLEISDVATPYVHTDGATASRVGAHGVVPAIYAPGGTTGWAAFRIRQGWTAGFVPNAAGRLFRYAADASNVVDVQIASTFWLLNRLSGGAGTQGSLAETWAYNTVNTLVIRWTAANMEISRNGAAFTRTGGANTATPNLAGQTFEVGAFVTAAQREGCLDVLMFALGNGTPSDANAALIHALFSGNRRAIRMKDLPADARFYWLPQNEIGYGRR